MKNNCTNIVIIEFTKRFTPSEVDEENKEGYFIYKRVINRIVAIVNEINPSSYPYAKKFNSTIVKGP
jgi:hypothetical protein